MFDHELVERLAITIGDEHFRLFLVKAAHLRKQSQERAAAVLEVRETLVNSTIDRKRKNREPRKAAC